MKAADRALQAWRIREAIRYIPTGAKVLDVGCFDDTLFRHLGTRLGYGIGIDSRLTHSVQSDRFRLIPGRFPDATIGAGPFDVVTMLAVLEHVPETEIDHCARACHALLVPGGLVVATVPSPAVDALLAVLVRLRIVEGMALEQHHGFDPRHASHAFRRAGFTVVRHRRFQLGLNNLFVFART